jgi:hypothetical protein
MTFEGFITPTAYMIFLHPGRKKIASCDAATCFYILQEANTPCSDPEGPIGESFSFAASIHLLS